MRLLLFVEKYLQCAQPKTVPQKGLDHQLISNRTYTAIIWMEILKKFLLQPILQQPKSKSPAARRQKVFQRTSRHKQ